MAPRHVFLTACLFALIAAGATALLALRAPGTRARSVEELAG
jgi:hypothetical protein